MDIEVVKLFNKRIFIRLDIQKLRKINKQQFIDQQEKVLKKQLIKYDHHRNLSNRFRSFYDEGNLANGRLFLWKVNFLKNRNNSGSLSS
jgi:hypothetical protein